MPDIFCYMTAKTREEACTITEYLLENRLIAGANMFPVESRYRWKDEICRENEYAVFMQTRSDLFPAVEKAVKHLHSYEIPCIVELNIDRGNPDFLHWIHFNTARG